MMSDRALFADRRDAGRKLAGALQHLAPERPVILALPRGGVPVGYEVAAALDAPLDLLFVRKIGAPGHPEFGIGAVVDGHEPQLVINPSADQLGVPRSYIEATKQRELAEIERRRAAYLHGRAAIPARDRTVIVVDDGIATGGTVRAALQGLSRVGTRRTVLAVPVAADDTIASLAGEADEIVCLATPDPFYAVGLYYADFTQTSDEEVVSLLEAAHAQALQDTKS